MSRWKSLKFNAAMTNIVLIKSWVLSKNLFLLPILFVLKNGTLLERPHCLRIQRLSKKYWRGPAVSIRGRLHNSLPKRWSGPAVSIWG